MPELRKAKRTGGVSLRLRPAAGRHRGHDEHAFSAASRARVSGSAWRICPGKCKNSASSRLGKPDSGAPCIAGTMIEFEVAVRFQLSRVRIRKPRTLQSMIYRAHDARPICRHQATGASSVCRSGRNT